MNIAGKLDALETRAAGYVANPGPAGEVQQRASSIIGNHHVTVIRRDGKIAHYEIQSASGHISFAKSHAQALRALGVRRMRPAIRRAASASNARTSGS